MINKNTKLDQDVFDSLAGKLLDLALENKQEVEVSDYNYIDDLSERFGVTENQIGHALQYITYSDTMGYSFIIDDVWSKMKKFKIYKVSTNPLDYFVKR